MTFVLIHDTLLDNPVLRGKGKRKLAYSPAEAFVWLIGRAARRPYSRDGIALARGELTFSYRYLAEAWGWTPSKVQRYLGKLEKNDMVDTRSDTGQLVVTIRKYREYQDPKRGTDTRLNTVAKVEPIHSRYKGEQESNREVGETRSVDEEGGPGGRRRKASPSRPPEDDRRGYGTDAALPGQLVLPEVEVLELEAVEAEYRAPDLGSPAIVVEVPLAPAPVAAPPPEVGTPMPASNVVAIKPEKPKRERAVKTRWPEGEPVPPEWIAAGYELAFKHGMADLNVEEVAEKFVAHWVSTGGVMASWRAAWTNWILNEKRFYRGANNGNGNRYNGNGVGKPVTGQAATVALGKRLAAARDRG